MKRFSSLIEIGKVVLIVFLSAIIIRTFVFQPFLVEGSSMEPSFHDGEYLMVEKLGYYLHPPRRGDVIVFKYPNNPSVNYIKRIIGLPGETVRIENGQVEINGKVLHEDYLNSNQLTAINPSGDTPYEKTLTNSEYFMMGDNRDHSSDSREWGPLDKHFIIGRSSIILFPRQDLKAVASPNYQ